MKQILIATHGKMASGIRYTAELIVGKMDANKLQEDGQLYKSPFLERIR